MLAGCGQPLATARTTATTRTPGAVSTRIPGALPPAPTAPPEATATQVAAPIPTAVPPTENATSEGATPEVAPPEAATPAASATASAPLTPTLAASPIVLATRVPIAYNERWRQQELDRKPVPAGTQYTTAGTDLYWYDPVFGQSVLLGSFRGNFDVLATFTLRSTGQPCLEVLYEVNKRYGLTAISPALVDRISAAGYTNGFIDTYVVLDERVSPR